MNQEDLKIGETSDAIVITAVGRANFEYAVHIRELVRNSEGQKTIRVDLQNCLAMDSTFMGVLSMAGLIASEKESTVEIYNASDALKKSLYDLGIDELFVYKEGSPGLAVQRPASNTSDMLTKAETVVEAHQKLVEADDANSERFEDVIQYAEQDVERLKKQS